MSNAQEALEDDLDRRMLMPAEFGIWQLCHAVAKRRLLLSHFSEIYQSSVRERFARLTQMATILCSRRVPEGRGSLSKGRSHPLCSLPPSVAREQRGLVSRFACPYSTRRQGIWSSWKRPCRPSSSRCLSTVRSVHWRCGRLPAERSDVRPIFV